MQNFVIFHYSLPVGTEHHPMALFTVCLSGSSTNVQLPLLSPSRVQTPLYVSHYCLPVGLKHHRMSPITLSLGFKHFCMSPITVSVSGSNTTVRLPSLSLSRVLAPLYVSHYCLNLGFQYLCMYPHSGTL